MNYTINRKETGRKSGKFTYQVIDENGAIMLERNSNREYVACTADGRFFFGRLDLIGKGDHGRDIKFYSERLSWSDAQIIAHEAKKETLLQMPPAEFRAYNTAKLATLNTIAYL